MKKQTMKTSSSRKLGPCVRPALLAALVGVLASGGCSDEPGPAASLAAGIDLSAIRACDLLTPGEIEAATGVPAGAGRDVGPAGGVPVCNWPRIGSDVAVAVTLLVTRSGYRDYEDYLADLRDSPLASTENDVEPVGGAGDFGVWMPAAMMLQVYDGDVMVQVDAEVAAGRDELEASTTLARAALAKLR